MGDYSAATGRSATEASLRKRIIVKMPQGRNELAVHQLQVLADHDARHVEDRMPADEIGERRHLPLDPTSDAIILAEVIDEHDLAAGLRDARQLEHHLLRIRHDRDDIHRNDRVEGIVGKSQVAGIHFMQAGDVRQSFGFDALAGLFEHLGREIDADDIEVLL